MDPKPARKITAVLLDLDGTLYFKGELIPGANEALGRLRQAGMSLRFLTNTDSTTAHGIYENVRKMGLEIGENEVFSPATALEQFLRYEPTAHCQFLVSQELAAHFERHAANSDRANYVVVGDFRHSVSYDRLNEAFRHIMNGAEILALQTGRYFYNREGCNLDTGAFVALLEYASGKQAHILGKPSPSFFELAIEQIGCKAEETAVVGDDISTDIAGANALGATAILVKTGKYNQGDRMPTARPDMILDSIIDVPDALIQ